MTIGNEIENRPIINYTIDNSSPEYPLLLFAELFGILTRAGLSAT